jgi:hypothetical protein
MPQNHDFADKMRHRAADALSASESLRLAVGAGLVHFSSTQVSSNLY